MGSAAAALRINGISGGGAAVNGISGGGGGLRWNGISGGGAAVENGISGGGAVMSVFTMAVLAYSASAAVARRNRTPRALNGLADSLHSTEFDPWAQGLTRSPASVFLCEHISYS